MQYSDWMKQYTDWKEQNKSEYKRLILGLWLILSKPISNGTAAPKRFCACLTF